MEIKPLFNIDNLTAFGIDMRELDVLFFEGFLQGSSSSSNGLLACPYSNTEF
jgi:hypothetical protein